MDVQITITLSADLYERLKQYATQHELGIAEAATTILENAFPPLISELDNRLVTSLSDADLIDANDKLIDDVPNTRIQLLHIWQQAGKLTDFEQIEMQMWDAWYDANKLRKVQLTAEIVKRGLK